MLPVEPRFAPLSNTVVDGKNIQERKMTRSHSFSGFVPYYLPDKEEALDECLDEGRRERVDSDGSTNTGPSSDSESETLSPMASTSPVERVVCWADADDELGGGADSPCIWPDTDDEWEGPSQPLAASAMYVPMMPQAVMLVQATMPVPKAVDEKVIVGLGKALAQAAEEDAEDCSEAATPNCFTSVAVPALSIQNQVWHYQRCGCSEECFVLALIYMSRVAEVSPGKVMLNQQTVHRLLLTALSVAAKFHDRSACSTQLFAEASGLALAELDFLQANFLELIDWDLSADAETFQRIRELLCDASEE
eukprot:gb/GFBE01060868.1/.p1 GENE.gb/GFBE01060868.1/~~gb/GFBE01060868.1/.p1  ORF type:complete len:307 (+),score=85.84 gb/GFBE01060868.1/:1-921(+)